MLFHHQLWINHKFAIQFFQFINKNEHSRFYIDTVAFGHEKQISTFFYCSKPKLVVARAKIKQMHLNWVNCCLEFPKTRRAIFDDEKLQQCAVIQSKLETKNAHKIRNLWRIDCATNQNLFNFWQLNSDFESNQKRLIVYVVQIDISFTLRNMKTFQFQFWRR